jgi:hypothetical protein
MKDKMCFFFFSVNIMKDIGKFIFLKFEIGKLKSCLIILDEIPMHPSRVRTGLTLEILMTRGSHKST